MDKYKNNKYKNDKVILDPIQIENNSYKYIINFEIKENMIIILINDNNTLPSVNYNRTMSLKEIKYLNEIFASNDSLYDFYSYLKLLSDDRKLGIKKSKGKLSIFYSQKIYPNNNQLKLIYFPEKKKLI